MNWILISFAFLLNACGNETSSSSGNASAAASASGSEKTYIAGTNAMLPPFESKNENDELVGFDIDLMNALAKAG